MDIKRGLGKGLDALFQPNAKLVVEKAINEEDKKRNDVQTLDINQIITNENQPRKTFDQESLNELAKSIERYGIVQPLVVVKNEGKYDLVAGERRLRAAKSIGLTDVPVIIKDYDEQTKSEIALIENIQRENLNTLEQAQSYKYLMDTYGLSQEQLAKSLGKSRSSVANSLRILKLSDTVKEYIKNDELTEGHCKVLVSVQDKNVQEMLANKVVKNGLSVRQLEDCIKNLSEEPKTTKVVKKVKNVWIKDIEEQFKNFFQTKVEVKEEKNNKGKIIVEYYSNDELDRILEIINRG